MRVFTVLGPSQSGKSTLIEGLAGLERQRATRLDMLGRVTATQFTFMAEEWCAIDIPGGADRLATAGPALAASDAVVLCVSADPDAAVLAAPYFRLIEEAEIPCLLFVNRVDVAQGRMSDVIASLQIYCRHSIALRQVPIREGDQIVGSVDLISERAWQYQAGKPSALIKLPSTVADREQEARTELLEALADFDDALLEQLIEDQAPLAEDVYQTATAVLQHHDLVPAFLGSAEHRNGMQRLMKSLRHEAPDPSIAHARLANPAANAVGLLGDHVKHLGKVVMVRAFGSGISQGDTVAGESVGHLTQLDTKTPVSRLSAGELGLTLKSDHLNVGRSYSPDAAHALPNWAKGHAGSYARIIVALNDRNEARLNTALDRLMEIDPGLHVAPDPQTGHAVVSAQGLQHFRHVIATLHSHFALDVADQPVPPAYRETIRGPVALGHRHRKQSGGAGQFADVEIEVRPSARGSGEHFKDVIKGGAVPRNYIPAVENGARDALMEGLNGHPVVDVEITLTDGKHHAVDSSDFAFRTAGKNAVKEALLEAGTHVLEPIAEVLIHLPSIYAGGMVTTVSALKGQVIGFEGHPTAAGWDVFRAMVPMSELEALSTALASSARGTGWFTAEFDHYAQSRVADPATV